jgi:hypothetical protein
MKQLTTYLHMLHTQEHEVTCEEAAKTCFTDIVVNLHELIRLGFTPEEIEQVLDSYIDPNLDSAIFDILVNK